MYIPLLKFPSFTTPRQAFTGLSNSGEGAAQGPAFLIGMGAFDTRDGLNKHIRLYVYLDLNLQRPLSPSIIPLVDSPIYL